MLKLYLHSFIRLRDLVVWHMGNYYPLLHTFIIPGTTTMTTVCSRNCVSGPYVKNTSFHKTITLQAWPQSYATVSYKCVTKMYLFKYLILS